MLHYSLVNVLISNRAELGQLPQRRLNDPAQMSPLLRSLTTPKGRASSFPLCSHSPLFIPPCGTHTLYFICVSVCLIHQTGLPMDTSEAARQIQGTAIRSKTTRVQFLVRDSKTYDLGHVTWTLCAWYYQLKTGKKNTFLLQLLWWSSKLTNVKLFPQCLAHIKSLINIKIGSIVNSFPSPPGNIVAQL